MQTSRSPLPRRTAAALAAGAALLLAGVADAQTRRSPLDGQPAVRHKFELRDKRFQVSPTFDMSVAADYKHTLSGGLKLEYHLTDGLSLGGMAFFGGGMNTGLMEQIHESLPTSTTPGDPTPSRSQFRERLNTIPFHGSLHATITPWFGKLSLFGKSELAFDVYVRGGLGLAQTKNGMSSDNCAPTPEGRDVDDNPIYNDPRNDCAWNSGFHPGIMIGGGLHLFLNRWMALDLSLHNYMFNDNPSGLDFNGDLKVDADDKRFLSHLFFGVGISLFLPPKVKISP
jgi:outer membrane beta-barrel protein